VTHVAIARDWLALFCGAQGLGTLVVDLNRTHATNPLWMRHARFHLVWQATSYAFLSLVEIALVLIPGPFQQHRFYLTVLLASIPMFAFFAALIGRRFYGGALSDPNGIPPARIVAFGAEREIDLSVAAEVLALLMLLAIVTLFAH